MAIMLFFLFLILGIYLSEPQQTTVAEKGGLKGLKALNIQDLGPWVVEPTGNLTKADQSIITQNNNLFALAQNRLKKESVALNGKVNTPKLKLLLDYGNNPEKLALRGTRQLQSLKLVLEDDVDLNRQPPQVVPLVTWSASINTKEGSGSPEEIKAQFEQLLDKFVNDLHTNDGAVHPTITTDSLNSLHLAEVELSS